jgi:hypothetical protein
MNISIRGIAPMLQHNNQTVNPLNKYAKQIKTYTSKRKKADEDYEAIAKIEWEAGLYYNDTIGVFVPSANVEAMLRDAAKKLRKGTDIKQSLRVYPLEIPLKYNGVRKLEELKKIAFSGEPVNGESFCDIRSAKVNANTIMRCRPRFNQWGLDFDIEADEAVFNKDDVVQILAIAGHKIGLSDYRPRYGMFEVVKAS